MLQKMYDREHGGGSGRGFAAMDDKAQREIARKGGAAVSENRQHMADIGRKGGKSVSQNRSHMAEIGRRGGEASHRQDGANGKAMSREMKLGTGA